MLTRWLVFALALVCIFDDAVAATKRCERSTVVQGPCIVVTGTLKWWHNFPPFLRIESDDRIYGIWPPAHENVPQMIRALRPFSTRGNYLLCPLNQTATVPYDQRPIELFCIEKAAIKERQTKLGRKIVWTRLRAPLSVN